jgi:hypothetical protein
MIWFFERQNARLRYEIRRQADGHDYELVITRPDGGQDLERYDDALELLQRTESLERSLREDGWQVPAPRGRALAVRISRFDARDAMREAGGARREAGGGTREARGGRAERFGSSSW